jgi:hypothetical protein
MSDRDLPADPDSWPVDPFQLLGVVPGVSTRDLKKAYHRLIRVYKPEHHPDEFQKIRQAYEQALAISQRFEGFADRSDQPIEIDIPVQPEIVPKPETSSTTPHRGDPWDLACEGKSLEAYQALQEILERGRPDEETFLQLYWLLSLVPELDSARLAIDWLIRGLMVAGSRAGRLRELLRRELAADPSLATSDRLGGCFERSSLPSLVEDVAAIRWKAARSSANWALILNDIASLRNWLPDVDLDSWARLLLMAAAELSWGSRLDSNEAQEFCREVEGLAHHQNDFADELYQVEFVLVLKAGFERLGGHWNDDLGLANLLANSWDEPGPSLQKRLRTYVDQLLSDPRVGLEKLDRIQALAPAVLGRLSTLLGGLDVGDHSHFHPRIYQELIPAIGRFLDEHRWNDYPELRLPLLRFC